MLKSESEVRLLVAIGSVNSQPHASSKIEAKSNGVASKPGEVAEGGSSRLAALAEVLRPP